MVTLLKRKLELVGLEVVECHEDVDISLDNINFFSIIKASFKLLSKHRGLKYDIVIIPLWWGAIQLPLLKLISRKPVIYYAYVSPYDELVNDRKKVKSSSLIARIFYIFEKVSVRFSNIIIKESQAEIDYYLKLFGNDKKKFRRLFISADEEKFRPCPFKEKKSIFEVFFFGTFIPLHGIDFIIEAAKNLKNHEDIVFKFCGDGQTKKDMEDLAKKYHLTNVKFLGFVPFKELLKNIENSDVCLGIFGKSAKASYVVTNKVYQILCSQKPLITMDSSAIREINLENKKNCLLVSNQSPSELSDAILYLKENDIRRKEIAFEGRKTFQEKCSMLITGNQFKSFIKELIS